MGRNRIVAPGSDRVEISDGDWVEIKRVLNTGDSRKLEAAGLKPPMMVGDKIISPIDWAVYELERALIYLTEWSLCGPDGKVLPLNLDSIKALDVESFNEINKAILAHRLEVEKAKNPMKTTESPNGGTEPPQTPNSEMSESETT